MLALLGRWCLRVSVEWDGGLYVSSSCLGEKWEKILFFDKKSEKCLHVSKITSTFASLLRKRPHDASQIKGCKHWKGGRVVDYSGLENRRAERHRGFESLPFRREDEQRELLVFFYALCFRSGSCSDSTCLYSDFCVVLFVEKTLIRLLCRQNCVILHVFMLRQNYW